MEEPHSRVRDLAAAVRITERAVMRILSELHGQGVIQKERLGRRNVYSINTEVRLRHPLEAHCTVGELLGALSQRKESTSPANT